MRGAGGLDGNRIWRVATPRGSVLQKLYAERGGTLHARIKDGLARLRGGKTSARAAARRLTEARLLALWRQAGCEVPRDVSGEHPDLANERTLVLEDVPGPLLSAVLADPATPPAHRDALLSAFARDWCRRHRLALERGEAALVHEHGSLQHVIVSGERLVSFDLENAFLPRRDLLPLIAKEVASVLRSLAKVSGPGGAGGAGFRRDVATLVAGYADTARLSDAARHYLAHPNPVWRALWRLDRRGKARKYEVLEVLRDVLEARRSP